jgi:hypothetical protein
VVITSACRRLRLLIYKSTIEPNNRAQGPSSISCRNSAMQDNNENINSQHLR